MRSRLHCTTLPTASSNAPSAKWWRMGTKLRIGYNAFPPKSFSCCERLCLQHNEWTTNNKKMHNKNGWKIASFHLLSSESLGRFFSATKHALSIFIWSSEGATTFGHLMLLPRKYLFYMYICEMWNESDWLINCRFEMKHQCSQWCAGQRVFWFKINKLLATNQRHDGTSTVCIPIAFMNTFWFVFRWTVCIKHNYAFLCIPCECIFIAILGPIGPNPQRNKHKHAS